MADERAYDVEREGELDGETIWTVVGTVAAAFPRQALDRALSAEEWKPEFGPPLALVTRQQQPGVYRVFESSGYTTVTIFDTRVRCVLDATERTRERPSIAEAA